MIINWIKVGKHWKVASEIFLPVLPTPGVAEIGLSRNDSDAFVLSAALAATHRRRRREDGGTACRGRPHHLSRVECDQGQCECPNRLSAR
jgi:hypothetical protein